MTIPVPLTGGQPGDIAPAGDGTMGLARRVYAGPAAAC